MSLTDHDIRRCQETQKPGNTILLPSGLVDERGKDEGGGLALRREDQQNNEYHEKKEDMQDQGELLDHREHSEASDVGSVT